MSNATTVVKPIVEKTGLSKHLQRLGFGASDMACNFIWQVLTIYIMMYYTDIAHIPVFFVSFLFLFARLIDGFTDVIMGVIIDKTKTKWGKSRPWFLFGAIPFGLLSILCFAVPTEWGESARIIYAYITYIGISCAYTMVNAPISAVLPALTSDKKERTVLVSYRMVLAFTGSALVTLTVAPLVSILGNGDDAAGVLWTMTIFSSVGTLLFFFTFATIEEVVPQISEDGPTFKEAATNIKINKHLWLFLANMCLMWGSYFLLSGVMLYYFAYVVHSPLLFVAAPFLLTITQIISSALTPTLSKPFPKKKQSYSMASVINIIGLLIVFVVAFMAPMGEVIGHGQEVLDGNVVNDNVELVSTVSNSNWTIWALFLGMLVVGFGHGWRTTIYYAMLAEPIDYGEWQTGVNTSGISSSLTGFFAKGVLAVAGALPTFLFGFTNYISGDVIITDSTSSLLTIGESADKANILQTGGTNTVIISCFIILPLVLAVASWLLVSLFWTIDDEIDAVREDLNNGLTKESGSAAAFIADLKQSRKSKGVSQDEASIEKLANTAIEVLKEFEIKKVAYCATKVRITIDKEIDITDAQKKKAKDAGYFGIVVLDERKDYIQFIAPSDSKVIALKIKEILGK